MIILTLECLKIDNVDIMPEVEYVKISSYYFIPPYQTHSPFFEKIKSAEIPGLNAERFEYVLVLYRNLDLPLFEVFGYLEDDVSIGSAGPKDNLQARGKFVYRELKPREFESVKSYLESKYKCGVVHNQEQF